MIDWAIDYLKGLVFPGYFRSDARTKARIFISSAWQKDIGYGSRRYVNYAGNLGYDQPMMHPDYVSSPIPEKIRPEGRRRGRPAGKYVYKRDKRGNVMRDKEGKLILVLKDPRYPFS